MRLGEVLYAVGGCLLFLYTAHASTEAASEDHITYTHELGETGTCLPQINAARERADLSAFVQATSSIPDSANQLWMIPCDQLVPPEEQFQGKNELFYKSAYASIQIPSNTPNCTEAVEHWQDAISNFSNYTLPPPNDLSTPLYSDRDNISFVAIYNPSKDATADCRVFTCTQTTLASPEADPSQPENIKSQKSAYSLICLTTPDILAPNGPAPFTEEQWKKIKDSLGRNGVPEGSGFNIFIVASAVFLSLAAFW